MPSVPFVGCSDAAPWPVSRIASDTVARRASVKLIVRRAVRAADRREQRPVAGERATAVRDAQVAEERRRGAAGERARAAREEQQAARAGEAEEPATRALPVTPAGASPPPVPQPVALSRGSQGVGSAPEKASGEWSVASSTPVY